MINNWERDKAIILYDPRKNGTTPHIINANRKRRYFGRGSGTEWSRMFKPSFETI